MPDLDLTAGLSGHDRTIRRLEQKLLRAETNLRRLEDQREGSAVLHAAVIKELEHSRLELERKNTELEALTARLELSVADLTSTQERLATSERRATQASRAKSTFLANMSHELRTPLNAIIGYAELLEESQADDVATGVDELRRIRRSGQQLLRMIDQILDLSKIEAGRMTLDVGDIRVPDLVDSIVATITPAVKRKGLLFAVDVGDIEYLRTDGHKLHQVLLNLLSNAVKFTEAGSLGLAIRSSRSHVRFVVRDTGVGMNPEQQARVFLAFEQADPSTTRRFGGTGLGLAISQRFCTLLGGRLSVTSEVGVGTAFAFELPLDPVY